MFTRDLLNQFLDRFDDDRHEKIVNVYITSLENHSAACQTAIQDKDYKGLQARVHDVKAICFTLKYDEAGALALKIEDHLLSGNFEEACTQMSGLLACINEILAVLKDWR